MTRIEAAWLSAPETAEVMAALAGEAFFVGGCVRNSLLGRPVDDIDLATPLIPQEVIRRAEAAGLKAVPTGIDHGTVTLVSGGRGFEVTTFRRDVETDGRHAVVAFSTDLAEDAARRDFTMNALYARADGSVIDPLGGLADLEARRVRFILDPEARIHEDALRILRFFRFSAWYGDGIEAEGLAACAGLAEMVDRLARERLGAEMLKLLAAPDPAPSVAAMRVSGVLARVLPGAVAEALAPLVAREAVAGAEPDALTRLAALGPEEIDLRLPNRAQRALAEIRQIVDHQIPPARAAADFGAARATQAHLILTALSPSPWAAIAAEIKKGAEAVFPLTARDLIAAGLAEGPELGKALATAREAWIASGFTLDKAALLSGLER